MRDVDVPEFEYPDYSDRQLVAIPLAVLALALVVLLVWALFVPPVGTPVNPGIDFTGGTEMHVETTASQEEIEAAFTAEVESIQPIAAQENVYVVTFQSTDTEQIRGDAETAGFEIRSESTVSASFGAGAQTEALLGVAIAFLGMSVLVFLMFRTFVPSIAVVASAFSDIVVPLALMNLFGIDLSLATVAALLMIIGYSVDSDLVLNNHILRRRGDFYESAHRAMQTGVTMTTTSLAAMSVMTIVAYLLNVPLLPEIGIVLVFGLLADLMNTYLMNMSLLRWYKYEGVAR